MKLGQAFKIAYHSIAAKKSRSFLTMLGVVIGVAAVIILVSYAQGQNRWMQEYYESMADNSIEITAMRWDGKDIAQPLYEYCLGLDEYVQGITPFGQIWNRLIIQYGAKALDTDANYDNWYDRPQVVMGNQEFSLCKAYEIVNGRDLSYLDVTKENQVCVLGSYTAEQLFDYATPVGKTITINNLTFEVIGVYQERDPNQMQNLDQLILVPYTLGRVLNNNEAIQSYVAKARSPEATKKAITLIDGFLGGLGINDANGYYYVQSPDEWKQMGEEEQQVQQRFLGGIAAISLAVGGIGIMNIMLVTVTERTREIGIRKAIGAERRSIVTQFLIEACMLCGFGGIIGIIVGYIGTLLVCKQSLDIIVLPSVGIIVGAFFLSLALGIVFGLFPAVKASKLQPVDALRAD
ncbi:MAG: ABC transporter permease [Oscillospiraceae bacterium]|nr:ABC transporter permease [Oscillospiraceae bacterium]